MGGGGGVGWGLGDGVVCGVVFSSPETPIQVLRFSHHARAHFFSRAYSFSCHLSQKAIFQLVAVTRKFLLNFL